MKIAVYPGSFDPITNGHVDILERTSPLFDKIIVAVVHNVYKQALFTPEERVALIEETTGHLGNIEVECFKGLLVDYLKEKDASIIIRGMRSLTDFEYESHMSMINKKLLPEVNTIFVMADSNYICVSSSGVKEAAMLGGDVSSMVPTAVTRELKRKLEQLSAK
ncbi:MAG: pantetheine-phosphate adenylyltransferase [Firmicutes bacterium HGW-Firmicutes-15]|nr:MAG: pantetheine-phosphate adenylyltransferase [Firmicutes bacterium HGW-Firmicutes-15]